MKIVFDSDATIVDYRRFVDRYAVPYFKRKYDMNVVYEEKLEIEDIFDCKKVLIDRGYKPEEAEEQTKKIKDKFWISPRYIIYSMPWMFFKNARKIISFLGGGEQGHKIEIHTSKMKATEKGIIGKLTRLMMYLQYWGNGCFISTKKFRFYENDLLKMEGIIASSPDVVFEDKPEIIECLSRNKIRYICVSGKHNAHLQNGKYVRILKSYTGKDVAIAMTNLLGERKYKLYNEIAKSDRIYKRLLKIDKALLAYFRPVVINKDRLITENNVGGIIYASNHRRTVDPVVITAVISEPIRYAALRRFFDAQDSIFNNCKNPLLCKVTSYMFQKLGYFPIEREQDYDNPNNMKAIKQMIDYANVKGKIGIFPEGTTLKNQAEDFGIFSDSFVKLAAATNSVIQPITIYWFHDNGKRRCAINFGRPMEAKKDNIGSVYATFVECQKELLAESKKIINIQNI